MSFDAAGLKTRHREIRAGQGEHLRLRLHRALSWLARAEREREDVDACFVFLWIALHAAYAGTAGFVTAQRTQANLFLAKLLALDHEQRLRQALFEPLDGPVRALVQDRHAFAPFWQATREHDAEADWQAAFDAVQRLAAEARQAGDTANLLSIVLDRLQVLRDRLLHGGVTWNDARHRDRVKDGVAILGTLLPIMLDLMMDAGDETFAPIAYPAR